MWIRPQLYSWGLGEILCRIGKEAVWNWMLFLPSHHYLQTLTKAPNLPVPLNLCFKMKDMSNGGSFLIRLFTERRGEKRRKKGALEPNFPSCSTSFVCFRPWATCWRKRQISGKIPRVFSLINQCPHSLFFSCLTEMGRVKERGRKTWVKEGTRTRGLWRQLLERLVRDFQPLTSDLASSPTWSR